MMKFNVDIFFKILAKENFKDLVNQMPILEKSETLFSYALAKGFSFNKKGLWYDFLHETDDSEPYNLSEKFKYIDKKLKAIELYEEEIREFPYPRSLKGVRIMSQYRGMKVYNNHVEAFELIKDVIE